MTDTKTITLPALPEGRSYVSIATGLTIVLGLGVGNRAFVPGDHTDAIRDGTYAYGLRRCSMDGGAMSAETPDTIKAQGVRDRADAIDAGTHAYGAGGGGSRLSTLTVVLREKIVQALTAIDVKKGKAEKMARDDDKKAYMVACIAMAKTIPDSTPKSVFGIMWSKIEAESKTEANRRDKAAGGLQMDDATRKAILALATAPKADEKKAA